MADVKPTNVHYVVFHSPGPRRKKGVDFHEQPGAGEHVQHYAQLLEERKLELGGQFLLDDNGGNQGCIYGGDRSLCGG